MIFERILVWSEVTSVWDCLIRGPTYLGRSDQRRFRARPQPGLSRIIKTDDPPSPLPRFPSLLYNTHHDLIWYMKTRLNNSNSSFICWGQYIPLKLQKARTAIIVFMIYWYRFTAPDRIRSRTDWKVMRKKSKEWSSLWL